MANSTATPPLTTMTRWPLLLALTLQAAIVASAPPEEGDHNPEGDGGVSLEAPSENEQPPSVCVDPATPQELKEAMDDAFPLGEDNIKSIQATFSSWRPDRKTLFCGRCELPRHLRTAEDRHFGTCVSGKQGYQIEHLVKDRKPEHSADPCDLDEGVYLWTMCRNEDADCLGYELTFGRWEDRLEFGVKHLALANNRKCVAGGEMRIERTHVRKTLSGRAGAIFWNMASGSITVPIVESVCKDSLFRDKCEMDNEKALVARVRQVWAATKCKAHLARSFIQVGVKDITERLLPRYDSYLPSQAFFHRLCNNPASKERIRVDVAGKSLKWCEQGCTESVAPAKKMLVPLFPEDICSRPSPPVGRSPQRMRAKRGGRRAGKGQLIGEGINLLLSSESGQEEPKSCTTVELNACETCLRVVGCGKKPGGCVPGMDCFGFSRSPDAFRCEYDPVSGVCQDGDFDSAPLSTGQRRQTCERRG